MVLASCSAAETLLLSPPDCSPIADREETSEREGGLSRLRSWENRILGYCYREVRFFFFFSRFLRRKKIKGKRGEKEGERRTRVGSVGGSG